MGNIMAHYAFIDENNKVVEVISGKNEGEDNTNWEIEYAKFRPGLICKRTSYNTRLGKHYIKDENGNVILNPDQSKAFRKNYAGIGYIYDAQRDAFYEQKPFNSWILDEEKCIWNSPVLFEGMTEEEKDLGVFPFWNENLLKWEKKKKNSSGEWEIYNSI
jgi:hypothetical protein